MGLDVTKCSNYKKKQTYSHCNAYKKLSLCCDCFDDRNNKCPYRVKYYREHPEMYIQFGKYKYTEYKKIPNSYMAWLLKQDLNDWLRCLLEDSILRDNKEELIRMYVEKHYVQQLTCNYSKSSHKSNSYYNSDLDYGGDLFDVMQGCGLNGD